MIRFHRFVAPLLALGLLAGCSGKVVPISVTVLTKKCGALAGPNPTDGVDHYKVRITGPDIDPIERTYAAGAVAPLEKIPAGHQRQLTLYGYAGDPSSGSAVVKAWGQSALFDVPETTTGTVQVNVVLRATGVFAGVPTIANETQCAALHEARAGHTATLLPDGRVLIAGGFNLGSATSLPTDAGLSPSRWNYLDTYEIFDPATNESKQGAGVHIVDRGLSNPYQEAVAFHTATLLQDGRVLLFGGETSGYARPNGMIYDGSKDTWTFEYVKVPELGASAEVDRSRHAAVVDNAGRVVVFGGIHYDANGNSLLTPEVLWRDPSDGGYHAVLDGSGNPLQFGRSDLTASAVLGGGGIAAAGGTTDDGGIGDPMLAFFQWTDADKAIDLVGALDSNSDNRPRTHAASSVFGPEQRLLLIAGGTAADGSLMSDTAVVDTTVASQHLKIPVGRGRMDPCAAYLNDGRVLVAGGELPGHATSAMADLYTEDQYTAFPDGGSVAKASAVVTGDLKASRVLHTCTVLQDGSVLVTGGLREENGQVEPLTSIELYTPVPLN